MFLATEASRTIGVTIKIPSANVGLPSIVRRRQGSSVGTAQITVSLLA